MCEINVRASVAESVKCWTTEIFISCRGRIFYPRYFLTGLGFHPAFCRVTWILSSGIKWLGHNPLRIQYRGSECVDLHRCGIYTYIYYLLTYSMEQSPSWEANRFSASQEIPRILWNPKVHYLIHKCRPSVPEVSVQVWGFLRWGVVSTSPNPQAGGPPLVGCPRLHIIQYIRSCPPYWRPFLHPRHAVVTGTHLSRYIYIHTYVHTYIYVCVCVYIYIYTHTCHCKMAQQPLVDQGLLIVEASQPHSIRHTTLGISPLDEWSAQRRDLYLTIDNTRKRQASFPPAHRKVNSKRSLAYSIQHCNRTRWEAWWKVSYRGSLRPGKFSRTCLPQKINTMRFF
jgi:hypothetical protein